MDFIDRERELRDLSQFFRRPGAQMVILYGRRRIGKTTLVGHWLEKQVREKTRSVYWVAHRSSSNILLKKFSRALQTILDDVTGQMQFEDWEAAVGQMFSVARKKRLVVVIDEFPYLVEAVPDFVSILQAAWDREAKRGKLFLLLSGSHYHMMHEQFLSGKGPLYGRSTADLLLQEIEPGQIELFLPRYSPRQIVETYSIVGGVPKYLEMWDDRKPVFWNLGKIILSPTSILRQEAVFLVQDEIPEPRTYLAVLEAIGLGARTPGQIGKHAGLAVSHVGKYLHTLQQFGFVRRIVSLDVQDVRNTRISRYEIKDPYLRFYYGFIYPNWSLIEQGRMERMIAIIEEGFDAFVAKTGYEELARRLLVTLGDGNGLPFVPDTVGRIWNRKIEIDVAAVNRRLKSVILGECKWTSQKMNEKDLDSLMDRSRSLARIKSFKTGYALFSRSGFTESLVKRATREHVMLFEGPEFVRLA